MSKVSSVVSRAISSSWCIATYRDSVTKMPQDKKIRKIKKFKEMMLKRKQEWINVGSREGEVDERRQRK